ncbi:Sec-independent protein translocase protein TatB [Lichenifustis flavocetrariae]|uniref:Sec-independent protein translocase protein TatB n=1 Tax=Lichenifustis flavocetrariae TaxID=2949735 RepID=A0AA42CHJ4_9HYPH|nr:Sec-independent protein translocase protein TatB [Lichenifustis flavocetrariae]MCW6507339.1 Sec-independent protein translocase protein TatB [Lichenifustis flavocetrariae]
MFDIDTGKILIVAALALIVIGPKDLPRVLRQVGQTVGKLRRMASEFQGQFMDAIKDAEIEDIRKELKDLETKADLKYNFDPVHDIRTEVTGALNAVSSEATVASPAAGFSLPDIPQTDDIAAVSLAEGVAPVVESGETATIEAPHETTHVRTLDADPVKRKLFVKPHHSRFSRLNSDRTAQLIGQAISVRQRTVRARKTTSHDVLSS